MEDGTVHTSTGGAQPAKSPACIANGCDGSRSGGQHKREKLEPPAVAYSYQPPCLLQNAFSSQLDIASSPPPPYVAAGVYDMAQMAGALPALGYRPGQYPQASQRYNPAALPAMVPQMAQMSTFGAMGKQGYYLHQPHMPQFYGVGPVPVAQAQHGMPPRQAMPCYPNQIMLNHPQAAYYYHHATQYPSQPQGVPGRMMAGQYMTGSHAGPNPPAGRAHDGPGVAPQAQTQGEKPGRKSAVRGPPRKPRQSGHAIWIGNLPPQTNLMNLVHHVCKETPGLESLFLISKSNCAFANFKDEEACVAAQRKLHESKFQSVRLVSRLRKNTVEGATGLTAPTGPAANSNTGPPVQSEASRCDVPSEDGSLGPVVNQHARVRPPAAEGPGQKDKFFILKSLTMEDLELSVTTGIWATQSHNEGALSNSFKNADNVYLIFSANKSGEYFGYARMTSEIDEDPSVAVDFAPKAPSSNDMDLPKAIATEATDYAPKGRIIDDSARGTIFWEAEREDSDGASDSESENSSDKNAAADGEVRAWGKPFKLEWLSTSRLPFYRTRGLRNPWNSNREVKIARDGTELEPTIGRRLIGLFNRVQSPVSVATPVGAPVPMMHGYPPMGPYGQ